MSSDQKSSDKRQMLWGFSALVAFLVTVSLIYGDSIGPVLYTVIESSRPEICPDYSSFRAPEPRSKPVEFVEHDEFKSLNPKYDGLWKDVLTPNGGFLFLMKDGEPTRYGISMFHQLHCLQMLRVKMQKMQRVVENTTTPEELKAENAHLAHDEHTMHCFDYLRQTILCSADDTIEPPKVSSKGKTYVDGMGKRVCKNWDLLYEQSVQSDILLE